MALDLGKVLAQNGPKMGPRERSQYIDIDKLVADERNFYELSDIDGLVRNIELIGLQQPIRVRELSGDTEQFRIVSGHRRTAALRKLVDEGKTQFRDVHCIVETVECSEAMQELRLIYANSDTRKMTGADLARQAERVEALLYQLKEEGYEFPGRMRDHVAQACQTSKSKLSRLKVIREKLAQPWVSHYEKNQLNDACAYALAKLPEEWQRKIYTAKMSKSPDLRFFYESTVEVHRDYLVALKKLECEERGGMCQNADGKFTHMVSSPYNYDLCHKKCCDKCGNLASCKHACPLLAEKVKQLKADKKEAKRQEKLAQEAAAAPKVELLSELWARFGAARATAGISVKQFRQAVGSYYYGSTDDRDFAKYEQRQDISESTDLPYGYNYDYGNCKKLIDAADCLGVSLDYLFGRTEQPRLPEPVGQLVLNGWMPGGTNPCDPCDVVAVFDMGEGIRKKMLCRWSGDHFQFLNGARIDAPAVKWMVLPPDEEDT